MPGIIPSIYEKGIGGVMSYDIFSKLLKERIMFVGRNDISGDQANLVISQLLYLDSESDQPINMYINSPGGEVTAGLAIYDTMQHLKAPVNTICMGMAMSMGAVLLSSGNKGGRISLPHARVMIHQPLIGGGGISGQATDISIEAKEMEQYKKLLTEIIAFNCGKPYKKVLADMERNNYMNPQEAKEYGLIDDVLLPTRGFAAIQKQVNDKNKGKQ